MLFPLEIFSTRLVPASKPKVMVAINNNPKALVFEQVKFGFVEDFRQFVPILNEKLKQYEEFNQ